MCYRATFGRCRSNRLGIRMGPKRSQKIWGHWCPTLWGEGVVDHPETCLSTTCVTVPNSISLELEWRSARKIWPVTSHLSRSLESTWINWLPMTSHYWYIVTMGISLTISKNNKDFGQNSQIFTHLGVFNALTELKSLIYRPVFRNVHFPLFLCKRIASVWTTVCIRNWTISNQVIMFK